MKDYGNRSVGKGLSRKQEDSLVSRNCVFKRGGAVGALMIPLLGKLASQSAWLSGETMREPDSKYRRWPAPEEQ